MRVRICDLRTGRRILDLPYLKADWTGEFNGAETVTATVSVNDRRIQKLDLYNASIPGRTALIIEDQGVTNGGPIWTRHYDRDAGTVELSGKGLWSYFDHRTLLPLMKDTDKLINSDGTANTGFDTNIKNTSYQTIAKRWIQQSLTWTGGNLPITFEDDMAGTYERNIKGAELKLIGDLLINLTEVQNGPDIRFQPRLTTDGLGYEWLLKTGKPRLTGNTTTIWDTSLPGNTVSDLTISQDANDLANIVWETGGAASDQAIIERATDHSFTGLGFPPTGKGRKPVQQRHRPQNRARTRRRNHPHQHTPPQHMAIQRPTRPAARRIRRRPRLRAHHPKRPVRHTGRPAQAPHHDPSRLKRQRQNRNHHRSLQ